MADRRQIVLLIPALALVFSTAPAVRAQTIQGIIIDYVSGRPIESASVELMDGDDAIVGQDVTDINGWFSMPVPDGEWYQVRSHSLGYMPTLSTAFHLAPGQALGAEIRMEVAPVELEGIEAIVARIEQGLDVVGFYDRREMGFGTVRTPEDLLKRPPLDLSDLFRGINGIRMVQATSMADMEVYSARRVFGDMCRPSISIDFIIVQRGERMSRLDVTSSDLERSVGGGREVRRSFWQDLVTPQEIAAMEVYPGQGGLPDWVSGDVSPCGAVLIWTKGYVATK